MAGSGENIPNMGEWMPPTPRTQAFLSSFLGEDLLQGNGNEVALAVEEGQNQPCSDKIDCVGIGDSIVTNAESSAIGIPRPGFKGGLAERMAARAGFNAPKLNTSEIRSAASLGSTPPPADGQLQRIPLSPGLSPSTFLDSPVFLWNSLAQPSPTTGKFPLGQFNSANSFTPFEFSDKNKDSSFSDNDMKQFVFKPHIESSSSYLPSAMNQSLPPRESSTGQQEQSPEISSQAGSLDVQPQSLQDNNPHPGGNSEPPHPKDQSPDFTFNQKPSDSALGSESSPPPVDQPEEEEQKEDSFSVATGQSEDGYNWRKYGQKQVKGSEFPRSYYKCTHPNCVVKKKVERSPEGHVTEIIYKGTHNHSKPPLNRRAVPLASHQFGEMQLDGAENLVMQRDSDRGTMWGGSLNGTTGLDWRNDGIEAPPSSLPLELCDTSISMHPQGAPPIESADTVDVSSAVSNDEDDDRVTHASASLGVDGEGEETESKKRKIEAAAMDVSTASRAVREPRVVVQTTSEVDILDDGYRWRKYGQKVVKGNPNPRSYYKCTSAGCTVRKHVERASHDLKAVITTYEGKHNHDVPAARNSSHSSNVPSNISASMPVESHNINRRPEPPQMQENFARYDAQANFRMPPRDQLGPSGAFQFGLSQPNLNGLAMAGLVPGAQMKMHHPQVHSSYMGEHPIGEPGFMIPKGEPKEETMAESSLPMPNRAAFYQQMIGSYPLGPQM